MKLGEIKKKFQKAKELLSEHAMLEVLLESMTRAQRDNPKEIPIDETYFNNVTKRLVKIRDLLDILFK